MPSFDAERKRPRAAKQDGHTKADGRASFAMKLISINILR
jgi:hypothetical protein